MNFILVEPNFCQNVSEIWMIQCGSSSQKFSIYQRRWFSDLKFKKQKEIPQRSLKSKFFFSLFCDNFSLWRRKYFQNRLKLLRAPQTDCGNILLLKKRLTRRIDFAFQWQRWDLIQMVLIHSQLVGSWSLTIKNQSL